MGEVLASWESPTLGLTVGVGVAGATLLAHPHLALSAESVAIGAIPLRTCTASLVDNVSLHVDPQEHSYATRNAPVARRCRSTFRSNRPTARDAERYGHAVADPGLLGCRGHHQPRFGRRAHRGLPPGALTGSGTTLVCEGVDTLNGAVVRSNPDYLKQLFLILLDNAFKYTPVGGTVTVRAMVHQETVAVSVSDTGIGIAAADLPHIFERFYRAANARAQGGMGLGLAIAQRVAEQHGGKIEVHSEVGRGSTFTVSLPT